MNKMTRRECALNIFAIRSRMMKVKGNYKNKYTDLTCRWCKNAPETQEHIMKECVEFKQITGDNTYETQFEDNNEATKLSGRIIDTIVNKIKQFDYEYNNK